METLSKVLPYLLLLLLFLFSYFLRKVSIPSILSFMLVGFLAKFFVSPHQVEEYELFKHAGIILLFFFIGLEYSFEKLKNMLSAWKTGSVDFIFNFIPPFILAYAFGLDLITALFLAAIFYPSSTSIVAKLLMDFKRIASPEAELLIGILIFEDLVAILLLSLLIPLREAGAVDLTVLPISLLKILLALGGFYLVHRFLIPKINKWLDEISEDDSFVFFILGVVLTVGGIFQALHISEALGAFLLGVIIPETKIFENIEKKLSDIKELSIGLFFFFFAYETELTYPQNLTLFIVLLILGVILKIISTYIAGYIYGLKRKARLRASLSFVPRGEFSVILSSFEPSVKSISIPFIVITAFVGSVMFAIAPKVADKIYPPKKKKKVKRFVKKPKKVYSKSPQAFSSQSQYQRSEESQSPSREQPPPS